MTRLRLIVRGEEFIVKKTVKKVADEHLELSLLAIVASTASAWTPRESTGLFAWTETIRVAQTWWTAMMSTNSRATLSVSCCWTSWAKTLSRFASASEVLSSDGGASARILPLAMTITRWQTNSTTSRTCEM